MSTRTERATPVAGVPLDIRAVRADFPILGRFVHERPLVYLDNAASSQKPQSVVDAVKTGLLPRSMFSEYHIAEKDTGNTRRKIKRRSAFESAVGQQSGDSIAHLTVYGGYVAPKDDFSIGLQGEGIHELVGSGPGIEAGSAL